MNAHYLIAFAMIFAVLAIAIFSVSISSALDRRWKRSLISFSFATAFTFISIQSALAANTKLSSLSAGGAMADADLFYDVQIPGAGGVKETGTQIWTWIQTHLPSPGPIGGTTPAAGNFTTLGATGNLTTNVTGGGTQCLHASNTGVVTGTSSDCGAGGGGVSSVTCSSGNTITTTGTCPAPFPGYVVNNWYLPTGTGSFATGTTVAANTIRCYYSAIFNKSTIGSVGATITTADTPKTGNFQIAVYANSTSTSRPGALLSSTTSSMTSSAIATVSAPLAVAQQVGPGGNNGTSDIWLCFNSDNSTAIFRSMDLTGSPATGSMIYGSAAQTTIMSASVNIVAVQCAGGNCEGGSSTFNTWPANLDTTTWSDYVGRGVPVMPFQISSVP